MTQQNNRQYKVTADPVRILIIDIAYVLIISGLLSILWVKTIIIWKIFAVFFAILFLVLTWKTSKPLITNKTLYLINDQGVTDYTQKKPVTIPWQLIKK